MKRVMCAGLVTVMMTTCNAMAQQQIQWKQTVNLPKGVNLPAGVKADILGVEIGDTYAQAKAKLVAILAEVPKPKKKEQSTLDAAINEMSGISSAGPLTESKTTFRLGGGGGITASYVSKITVRRKLSGTANATTDEMMIVRFSAPSSGHQVLAISRALSYPTHVPADQPRISELLAQLKTKYGPDMQTLTRAGSSGIYLFQYDGGVAVKTANPITNACYAYYPANEDMRSSDIPNINRSGNCDVILRVETRSGISPDHAAYITFTLSDNERAKANIGADFAFFGDYVRQMQSGAGAPPKL